MTMVTICYYGEYHRNLVTMVTMVTKQLRLVGLIQIDPLIQVVDYYALDKPNKYIKDQVIRRRACRGPVSGRSGWRSVALPKDLLKMVIN
jgi:hypothetical protein